MQLQLKKPYNPYEMAVLPALSKNLKHINNFIFT